MMRQLFFAGISLFAASVGHAEDVITRTPPGSRLSYRLLVPPGLKAGEKRPIVLWLHPSGGYMNEQILKDFRPVCEKSKLLLMLPESRSDKGWVAEDLNSLRDFLRDARENHAADTDRTVLLGCS